MTRIVKVDSVLDINFEELHGQGVRHVMSDIESTLCPYGEANVDPHIKDHLESALAAGHIATLHIITNKTDAEFLRRIKVQFDGIGIYFPASRVERKPSPTMLEKSMLDSRSHASASAMIGDKFTGDMAAARRAGVAYGFWVHRLGNTDHVGDRWIRRPYERAIRPFVR